MIDKDKSSVKSITLTENGIEKLWQKVENTLVNAKMEQRADPKKIDKLIDRYGFGKKALLFNWFSTGNGYEILPHEFLPGLVFNLVGQTYDDIFMDDERFQKVFIPWTEIEEIILYSNED
ncbi:hypothetical protein [Leuconostoc citreum]